MSQQPIDEFDFQDEAVAAAEHNEKVEGELSDDPDANAEPGLPAALLAQLEKMAVQNFSIGATRFYIAKKLVMDNYKLLEFMRVRISRLLNASALSPNSPEAVALSMFSSAMALSESDFREIQARLFAEIYFANDRVQGTDTCLLNHEGEAFGALVPWAPYEVMARGLVVNFLDSMHAAMEFLNSLRPPTPPSGTPISLDSFMPQ